MGTGSDVAADAMISGDVAAAAAAAAPPKKERHIVTWTPQEDDLLREQIALHGTDNWTSIAAQFKDKTSRQCRRRWYTYLNSECKKGGWSTEEDMLLCEAQKIFGNRWTEIAKVVTGRTDNAVKNRFSTLCKKRAKHEALYRENNGTCVDTNSKGVLIHNACLAAGTGESSVPTKQMRYHISEYTENTITSERLLGQHQREEDQLIRPPLAVLVQNFDNVNGSNTQSHVDKSIKYPVNDEGTVSSIKSQGIFLKRDDPKLATLLQQAELLSSLALKVNAEDTNQSLDDAWKELQDYLIQTEESGALKRKMSGVASILDDFKELIEDLKCSKEEDQQSLRNMSRQTNSNEDSLRCSEYSTEFSPQKNVSGNTSELKNEDFPPNDSLIANVLHEDASCSSAEPCPGALPSSENACSLSNMEFDSPAQTVQPFHSYAEEIPTPQFTASERHFLLTVLGSSSPASNPNCSQRPSCKRVLLDSL
ncbi:transcription factor MYB124-like isoform X2 [Ananas comosus]|uniref:Transcription factor MYB124-like isoform X2 n=1 Tax=Ananas comosus TaxID=4615 RepID=A0A6P5GEK9_ANACO|nr:transcription factor MYB124-like isoform X2 [Ananas comosus]XP_020106312.1 transcription factor MYB124-like isoform X2 [Ananas comosus]